MCDYLRELGSETSPLEGTAYEGGKEVKARER